MSSAMVSKQPTPPEKSKEMVIQTAPFDPRFPNTNQNLYCWTSYLDFHRCQKAKGEDYEPCKYFHRVYKTMCPNSWIERWDDQMKRGVFPGKI